jgi:hypothetical protein
MHPTPVVVRLMVACCPVVVRFKSGQQPDNKRTTSGQQSDLYRSHIGVDQVLATVENFFIGRRNIFVFLQSSKQYDIHYNTLSL